MSLYHCFAYIDPGTGSLIFQVLAATAMGVVVAFQSVRAWIGRFFRMMFGKNTAPKDSEPADDEHAPRSK